MSAALGILGGTFDPIHYGHLRPALELLEGLGLAAIHFVPCAIPPHRHLPVASAEQRLAMVRLALEGVAGLQADDRELHRSGPSYMVDTLESLRAERGEQPLCLILGLDAFLGLDRWHRWERILELSHVVIAHRPGWKLAGQASASIQELLKMRQITDPQGLCREKAGMILFQAVTQLDISATSIRSRLAEGRQVRYLLPDPVLEYIERQGLYQEKVNEHSAVK